MEGVLWDSEKPGDDWVRRRVIVPREGAAPDAKIDFLGWSHEGTESLLFLA